MSQTVQVLSQYPTLVRKKVDDLIPSTVGSAYFVVTPDHQGAIMSTYPRSLAVVNEARFKYTTLIYVDYSDVNNPLLADYDIYTEADHPSHPVNLRKPITIEGTMVTFYTEDKNYSIIKIKRLAFVSLPRAKWLSV